MSYIIGPNLGLVNPMRDPLLWRYEPGRPGVIGETFSRAGVAKQINASGTLVDAAVDELRDANWITDPVSGLLVRSTKLEATRTNIQLRSEELDNAAWTKIGPPTITANDIAAPNGNITADKIEDTSNSASQRINQTQTVANDSTSWTASAFIRKRSGGPIILMECNLQGGTAVNSWIQIDPATGNTSTSGTETDSGIDAIGSDWWRVWISVTNNSSGNTSLTQSFWPAYNNNLGAGGDATATGYHHIWGAQLENAVSPSSYIPTTTVAVTRPADSYSATFTPKPQAMTVYVKLVEHDTGMAFSGICAIGSLTNSAPRLALFRPATVGQYQVSHFTAAADKTSTVTLNPSLDDVIELLVRLYSDGAVDIEGSVKGAASVTGAKSAANALATAWQSQDILLNAFNATSQGFADLISVKVARDAQQMDYMRAA